MTGPLFSTAWEREEYEREQAAKRRSIWHVVADLTNPSAEPFMVMRVDTSIRREGGVEGTVMSLHWRRDEAESRARELDEETLPAHTATMLDREAK